MTNEEKAVEVLAANISCFNPSTNLFSIKTQDAIYNIAIEMAEWKEREMVERFSEWIYDLQRRYVVRNFHTGDSYTEKDMIHDIKLFLQGYTEKENRREELLQRAQEDINYKQ